ncbi:hypothetical protein HELRODRAFT_166018 [Helobdella robusta]|uniref:Antistasin-like domain-containing protein n=1 Tax=Helobdella robusta TaxID=6412 RepID=T1EXL7_HELRO|nr:hypothetical protein HELRODRAFT_166018 [Helobdella robusta]ESN90360.1 hypothetical protein HELRODRAFT_166018 [Helobdella robusta]
MPNSGCIVSEKTSLTLTLNDRFDKKLRMNLGKRPLNPDSYFVRDSFLSQLIRKPTRFWNKSAKNILDLVFVEDTNLIHNIDFKNPVGKSDHVLINFLIYIKAFVKPGNNRGNLDSLVNIDDEGPDGLFSHVLVECAGSVCEYLNFLFKIALNSGFLLIVSCPLNYCKLECKTGYRTDANGCKACWCADPCAELNCPNGCSVAWTSGQELKYRCE